MLQTMAGAKSIPRKHASLFGATVPESPNAVQRLEWPSGAHSSCWSLRSDSGVWTDAGGSWSPSTCNRRPTRATPSGSRARQLVDAGHAILDDGEHYGIYFEEYQGPPSDTFIQQVQERQRHDLGCLAEIVEREAFVGAMGIGLEDRPGAGAVEHRRDAGRTVMAGIGVER